MMIMYPHDSLNHRVGFGRKGPGFDVSCRRLDVPFSWWFIWFTTTKCIELVHISPKAWWEEFWTTDDSSIIFVSNYYTAFTNNFLHRAESRNNWLETCCIIVDGI